MRGSFLFLGTGASAGVPEIGCKCSVCTSSSEKNKRLRPSCLVKIKDKIFLVDVSPDFRYQALKYNIDHIDGLIVTHPHYDHIAGLDDLRIYYLLEKKAIPTLLSDATYKELKKSFHYLFQTMSKERSLSAQLQFQILEKDFGEIIFQGIKIKYLSYFQKETKVTGYKFGDLAYVSDIREYSDEIFENLKETNTLIISALRDIPSPVHFSLEEAVTFAEKVKPKRTYFTHIAHEVDHEKVSKDLPKNIFLAYDGLEIEFFYG